MRLTHNERQDVLLVLVIAIAIVISVVAALIRGSAIDTAAIDCTEDCESVNAWARSLDPCECVPYKEGR